MELESVSRMDASNTNPWIIQRDFNVTLSATEHSQFMDVGGSNSAMRDFQEVVRLCDLVDLAYMGPMYTWSNSQDGNPISKKLDRVLVNSSWLAAFPQGFTKFESGGVSDHLRVKTQIRASTPWNMKPFKLFTHVASHPRFLEVISQVWSSTSPLYHSRSALKLFHSKLKMLKSGLRGLNKEMFGDLPARVKRA